MAASGPDESPPRRAACDPEGYLLRRRDWSERVAAEIAADEGIALSTAHWEILWLLRAFYRRYRMAPAGRALVSCVKRELGPDKGRSAYLMRLFGGSAARTACKIAGLPRPENCI